MTQYPQERMIALVKGIKELANVLTLPELAQKTGVSHPALHRALHGKIKRFGVKNLAALGAYLKVSEQDIENYLANGEPGLESLLEPLKVRTATENSQDSISRQSRRLRDEFLGQILPKLNFWDVVKVSQEVSYRLWAMINKFVPNRETIAEVLRSQDLESLSDETHLPKERLVLLAQGVRPECHELTVLAACLEIDLEVLVAMRDRTFPPKNNQPKTTERKKTNGTNA